MKCRNIAAGISFLLAAVACSTEEIILDGALKKEAQQQSGVTELALSISININKIETRAGEIIDGDPSAESSVAACSVILFEDDNVVGAYDGVTATADGDSYTLTDAKFLVKIGRAYEVYVIGDTKQAFKACKTKTAVEAIAFGATDLDGKVKFGKADVSVDEGSSSALGETIDETIDVELSNLTAQIRLMDVRGSLAKGEEASDGKVQLTKVEVLNRNTAYSIDNKTAMNLTDLVSDSEDIPYNIPNRTEWEQTNIAEFATFPNTDAETPTQIRLTFKVGAGEVQTRTYTINRPDGEEEGRTTDNKTETSYINAGYIYNLYAKVTLEGDELDCELTCFTQDWLYNEYDAVVEEVEED
ncbi:MAG: hypothetical protein LBV32_05100 [Tannerellaceae bacterium]|jgi:hypothetical protein|nr:hypothetical protein [Tannerellaceae bacterium]